VEFSRVVYDGPVQGNDEASGSVSPFPLSRIEMARSCADAVDELDPHTRDGVAAEDTPDVSAMSDGDLSTALQQVLGEGSPLQQAGWGRVVA
jgi:hypothetical protein